MRWLLASVVGATLLLSSQAHAANWGDLKDDGCKGANVHRFSAVLWNIPWGSNWEATCAETPILDWGPPTRCVTNLNVWGEWDRPDPTCK